MKIELRNFKPVHSQSRETLCFSASIVVNSVTVGTISNDGGGGAMRTYFDAPETRNEVLTFIANLPRDLRWPNLEMNADIFFSIMTDAMVQAEEAKKQAKKEAAFAANAAHHGHRAFRARWTDYLGRELESLFEAKELVTVPAFVARLRSPAPISNLTIVELSLPKGELSLDEARGVMKLSEVLKAKDGLARASIQHDVSIDWLLERGFVELKKRKSKSDFGRMGLDGEFAFGQPMIYATKAGRAWFHATPGPGVAMLVIVKASKASAA